MAVQTLIDDYLKLEREKIEQLIYGVEPIKIDVKGPYHIDYAKTFGPRTTYPQAIVKLNNEKENKKMNAKRCDRCGRLYIETQETIKVYLCGRVTEYEKETYAPEKIKELNTFNIKVVLNSTDGMDMCPDCRKLLTEFFESGAEENKE